MNAVCYYYDIREIEAIKLFEKPKIYHPYGTVGKLDWQTGEPEQIVNFGEDIEEGLRLSLNLSGFVAA